jgi:hypothetical protein
MVYNIWYWRACKLHFAFPLLPLASFLLAFATWNLSDCEHKRESYIVWRDLGRLFSRGETQSSLFSASFNIDLPVASRLVSRRELFDCAFVSSIAAFLIMIDFLRPMQRLYVLFAFVISSATRKGFNVSTVTIKLWECNLFRDCMSDGQVFPKASIFAGQASTFRKRELPLLPCWTRAGQPWKVGLLHDFKSHALMLGNFKIEV